MDNNFLELENTLGMFESCFLKLFFVLKIMENTKNLFGSHLLYFKNTKKHQTNIYNIKFREHKKGVLNVFNSFQKPKPNKLFVYFFTFIHFTYYVVTIQHFF